MSDALSENLAKYLAAKLNAPDLTVHDLARIPGGASRETYRFRVRHGGNERRLILRRDPPASLIETERSTEYRAYEAFHKLGLPVPEPIALELGTDALERPFFIMAEIENAMVGSILAPDPYGAHRERIGQQFFSILGRIAGADPKALGLNDFEGASAPDQCWSHEVARWEKVIDEDEGEQQPIARAAIRWLKRNPPPPAQKIAVVHGDYRSGNFLFDANGDIRAILDWEMAHLGDPLEDLAWAIDPLWAHHDPSHPAGTLARADAIKVWEQASGLKADPAALAWWEMFASFKGCAIWISAAHEYATGRNDDPVNAFSGWYCLAYHNKVLADRLGSARMKPDAQDILNKSADQLMGQLAPKLNAQYSQGAAAVMALLMKFAGKEYERGADIRATENADIRALFSELATRVGDAALRKQLEDAAATRDTSLAISALNTANHDLRRILVALQIWVEDNGTREDQQRIWSVLKASADRRIVSLF